VTDGPFRHGGWHACPSCAATLREFQSRLICDHCGGIWIGAPDLASAIGDQRAEAPPELIARDGKRTETVCPCCPDALEDCRLDVKYADGTIKRLKQPFLRCPRDGLWCESEVLAGVLAVIGTRGFGGGSRGYTGLIETQQTGLDGLPASGSVRSASDGLAISAWRNRRRQRPKTLSPVNAYADRALGCPVCPGQELRFLGDRYACEQCTGIFVENAAVMAMVNEIAPSYWELPEARGEAGPRACPVCRELLVVEELETVAIDRCGVHGVWFDPAELATMLEHASGSVHEGGLRRWLARLFA
jgi:Zn-finger nucleic acid-binding protein